MANSFDYFRGDTRPIEAILTRDVTSWTLVGAEIKMTFEFSDGVKHLMTGVVVDDDLPNGDKLVEFAPLEIAVATKRKGKFDIQVDDGQYIATHIKGVVNIIQDVTE